MKYAAFRACERLDPRAIYGAAFYDLPRAQQAEFLGYVYLRDVEERRYAEKQNDAMKRSMSRARKG